MRKLVSMLVLIIILLFCSISYARMGYRLYISAISGNYSASTPIDCGLNLVRVVHGLTPGSYYAIATAYIDSTESSYSNEVHFTVLTVGQHITFEWDPSPAVPVPYPFFW